MRGVNATVTIWRKRFNQTAKKDEFSREVLPMLCKWDDKTVKTATDKGAVINKIVIVAIPYVPGYEPECYAGDYLALGEQIIEITGISPYTAAEVKKLLEPDFIQVKSVSDNTKNDRGKHWEIMGV